MNDLSRNIIEQIKKNEESMIVALEKQLDDELFPTVRKLIESYTDSQIKIIKSAINSGEEENGDN